MVPRQRKLRLAGLRLRDQTSGEFYVAGGPEEVQGGLKGYWCPAYSPKKVDADAAAKILGVYHRRRGNDFSFDQISFPGAQDYSNFIGRAGNSTPGRDGLPYIAYKGCREFAGEVFAETGDFLAVQEVPQGPSDLHDFLTDFNGQNDAFAPKGQEACDKVEPVRASPNLRTIFLTNTDNKTVAGAINYKIIEPVLRITPACQRGFCPGRQFTLNIVVLDTFLEFSTKFQASIPPLALVIAQ